MYILWSRGVTFYARFISLLRALIETFRKLWPWRSSANLDIHAFMRKLRNKVGRCNSYKSWDSRGLIVGLVKCIWELNESVLIVASITRQNIHLLWLGMIYQHVSESYTMRQEQVESVWDKTNVVLCFLDEGVNLILRINVRKMFLSSHQKNVKGGHTILNFDAFTIEVFLH